MSGDGRYEKNAGGVSTAHRGSLRTGGPYPFYAFAVFLFLIFLSGCNSGGVLPETLTADREVLRSETERGPVKVAIEISPKEPRLSDEPTLTLTVTAEDGVEVEMPPFGQSLGQFIIRDFHEPIPATSDGDQVLQQVYTLEPTLAGRVSVDPITVRFTDNRAAGDGKEHVIETEAVAMNVATMIESEAPSLNDLRPVAAPVDIPDPSRTSSLVYIAAGIAILIAALLLFRRLFKRKGPQEPELTPQQLAWREFQDLLSSKLSETDLKEYFVELTAVVRRYIERTTGVNAPDQTTEEFLREINRQKLFGSEVNMRLEAFLESADLVKFAGLQPDEDAVKQSTQRAKQFIDLQPETEVSAQIAESSVEASA